jgi:hypothetical protein
LDEPAFVLHHYDWSESSRILEVLTRHHGRVALVAKGAKRPTSNLRAVLLPLQPLSLCYSGDAEIRTLKSAEWAGGHVMPSGLVAPLSKSTGCGTGAKIPFQYHSKETDVVVQVRNAPMMRNSVIWRATSARSPPCSRCVARSAP